LISGLITDNQAAAFRLAAPFSDLAEKQENQHNYEDQSHASGRIITPAPAVRPPRQHAKKRQEKNHDQYRTKHVSLLTFFIHLYPE
jgi:hypothetical protein